MLTQPKFPKHGQNVLVRCLEKGDLDELYTIESDPDVKRFTGGPVRKSREEWVRGMESRLSWCQTLAVLAKDTGQFAGRAALNLHLDSACFAPESTRELQVVISKSFRGRHFGREVCKILIAAAFDELGAEQVIGVVHPENINSLKLLRLFGFEETGVVSDQSKEHEHLKFVLSRAAYQKSQLVPSDNSTRALPGGLS